MNTPNGNFIEPSIPNNNATITLNIAGVESTMKLVDFINAIQQSLSTPNLQEVTDEGATTTADVEVNSLIVSEGVQFTSNLLSDIVIVPSAPVTPDTNLEITLGGVTYVFSAQIKP